MVLPAGGEVAMAAAFSSEWIKHRRTATPWLIVLAPSGIVAFSSWYSAAGGLVSLPSRVDLIFQLWTMLCVPAGSALLAGLTADHEARAGAWRALRSRPICPAALYGAKLSVLAAQTLLATVLLCTLGWAAGAFMSSSGTGSLGMLLAAGLLSWICALPIIALQLCVATGFGIGGSVAVGVPGLLVAVLLGGTSLGGTGAGSGVWMLAPWAWPSRASGQLFFLWRDGIPAVVADAAKASVLIVAIVALVLTGTLALCSALWFTRKEVG